MKKVNIFWFRRDLRTDDNVGLHHALNSGLEVLPIFIFDTNILEKLEDKSDRRVDYIQQALENIHLKFKDYGSGLKTYFGNPLDVFKEITDEFAINAVYCNRDYEPQTIERDKKVADFLKTKEIDFLDFKDQVIFEKGDVLKADQSAYVVFTPYSKKWKELLNESKTYECNLNLLFKEPDFKPILTLEEIGFKKTDLIFIEPLLEEKIINSYDKFRDFPALDYTTKLGIALRFGTISVRRCVQFALQHNETWLNELIWREFFMQILYHYPRVVNQCFNVKYENISWRNNEVEFKKWCEGRTGYPIVDAGMRELNQTGFMHNRVRMIVASFLTKHLLIDWRWGDAYFASKLLDYDLSANNGNWQWAAGCGCDAAPYFRVFNPEEQTKKFDKEHHYIRKWLPNNYVEMPIVEHKFARLRALETYKKGLI